MENAVTEAPKSHDCLTCGKLFGFEVKIVKKYAIPFKCTTCGNIKFPYKALNGVVFVWPEPIAETQGSLYIPEQSRDGFKGSKGVVLTAGKGCRSKKTGEFAECEVTVGDVVIYDRNIPWNQQVKATDDKKYKVDIANMFDINAIVYEDEPNEGQSIPNSAE